MVNFSSPFLLDPGLINERSLQILFQLVTTSIKRISNEGFATYKARNKGLSGLSGWRAAFWAM